MKKFLCLIFAAAFLLLAGCQADDPSKTYTTDEIINKIEKGRKTVKSEEDRKNLVYVVKTVSKSKQNVPALSTTLGCFVEDEDEYALPFTETITVYPDADKALGETYTEAAVSYNSEISYIFHCEDKNWTVEIKK